MFDRHSSVVLWRVAQGMRKTKLFRPSNPTLGKIKGEEDGGLSGFRDRTERTFFYERDAPSAALFVDRQGEQMVN